MMRTGIFFLVLMAAVYPARAQDATPPARAAEAARSYRRANEHRIIGELRELLSIPNVASDAANIARNAARLRAMLEARGFSVKFLPTAPDRGPVIYAALDAEIPAARTVFFYAHYDGQPVDPAAWSGTSPFEPALRTSAIEAGGKLISFPDAGSAFRDEWRIYARSASDDKSPIVAILAAVDALKAKKIPRAVNVRLLLDGEEEAGSPNLERALEPQRKLLAGDVLITADGPVHQSGRPLVFYGNRGVFDVHLTVYGPARPLHSGHYGNWAPNPAMRLAQLLATMKDAEGRVNIEGFYDDVAQLSADERRALLAMPANDADLLRELKLGGADGGGKKLVELINLPSLNVRGLRSAYVGAESQNIIPTEARASLDVRLVKNCEPQKMFERIAAHVRRQGYFVVSGREPTDDERRANARVVRLDFGGGYGPSRTSMDLPVSRGVARAVSEATGGEAVLMPTLGGSAPMYIFQRLGLPVIGVPIVNHDNNQHAHDENLRLGNFWRGIEIYAALIAGLRY